MNTARILAFSGSCRSGSYNHKLVAIAAEGAREAGAEVSLISLADYPMPLYNGDLETEQGIPESAMSFKRLLLEHDGLLIACPEYNSSITPLLKNSIDWASRQAEGEAPLVCFRGKTISLMAASPGQLGGLRGLVHVRAILGNIGCLVLPAQVAVAQAGEAFDASGMLKDEKRAASVRALGSELAEVTGKLNP